MIYLPTSKNMNNYVLNPLTNRAVKIGGATHRRLINQGLMDSTPNDNELYKAESKQEAVVAKKMLAKQNKDKSRSVKIRNDGLTVIKARKRLTQKQISEGMTRATAVVLKRINAGELSVPDNASDDEVHEYIQNAVLREILNLSVSAPTKTEPKPSGYKLETPAVSDEDSDGSEYDELTD